jgi:lipopolysaccharide transport system permease protein
MPSQTSLRANGPLLRNLIRRDIRQRYKGSILGVGWTLVVPAVVVLTYTIVFRYLFRSQVPHYAVYLITGMTAWTFFANGAQVAASSLQANANLVKKIRFRREIIPIAAIAGNAATTLAMLAISVVLCLTLVPGNPVTILALPGIVLLLLLFTVGFGLTLSALNVYFRDVEYLFGALTMPWFFLTPILFAFHDLPENVRANAWLLRSLHYANPVTPFVFAFQDAVFWKQWPALGDLLYCSIAAGLMLTFGLWVFKRLEGEMAVEL